MAAKKKTTARKPKPSTRKPSVRKPATRKPAAKPAKKTTTTGRGSVPDRLGLSRTARPGTAAHAAHRRAALAEARKIGEGVDVRRVRSEAAQTGRLAGQARRAGADVRGHQGRGQRSREVNAMFNQTNRRDRNYTSSAYDALDTASARLEKDRERQRAGNRARKKATTAKKSTTKKAPTARKRAVKKSTRKKSR